MLPHLNLLIKWSMSSLMTVSMGSLPLRRGSELSRESSNRPKNALLIEEEKTGQTGFENVEEGISRSSDYDNLTGLMTH